MRIILGICLLIALVNVSCGGMKVSSAQKAGKHYESFYTGVGGVQYFIKPITFNSTTTDNYLKSDIVFRVNENELDSGTVNISIFTESVINRKPEISFFISGKEYPSTLRETFYQERESKMVITRSSYRSDKNEVYDFVKAPIDSMGVYSNGAVEYFTPKKKTQKILGSIAQKLIL